MHEEGVTDWIGLPSILSHNQQTLHVSGMHEESAGVSGILKLPNVAVNHKRSEFQCRLNVLRVFKVLLIASTFSTSGLWMP